MIILILGQISKILSKFTRIQESITKGPKIFIKILVIESKGENKYHGCIKRQLYAILNLIAIIINSGVKQRLNK